MNDDTSPHCIDVLDIYIFIIDIYFLRSPPRLNIRHNHFRYDAGLSPNVVQRRRSKKDRYRFHQITIYASHLFGRGGGGDGGGRRGLCR